MNLLEYRRQAMVVYEQMVAVGATADRTSLESIRKDVDATLEWLLSDLPQATA